MASKELSNASNEIPDLEYTDGIHIDAKYYCDKCLSCIYDSCKAILGRSPDLCEDQRTPVKAKIDCVLCSAGDNRFRLLCQIVSDRKQTMVNACYDLRPLSFCKTCEACTYICIVCMESYQKIIEMQRQIIVSSQTVQPSSSLLATCDNVSKLSHVPPKPRIIEENASGSLFNRLREYLQMPVKQEYAVDGARQPSPGPTHNYQVQIKAKPLADMRAWVSDKVKVRMKNDRNVPTITGCCFLPNGELVLCDYGNDKVKLLDSSLVLRSSLPLQGGPWDVAFLDGRNIVVTLPDAEQLQLIQISPPVKKGRTTDVKMKCRGVAVAQGQIYVSGVDEAGIGRVLIYDLSMNFKTRFGENQDGFSLFEWPWYISVCQSGRKVFVSDWYTDTLICLASDGNILWEYKDVEMRTPRGLYVDENETIILCNFWYNRINIILSEGKNCEQPVLLSSSDGIIRPYCVTLRPRDDTLVVGCYQTDFINVYKLY